MGIYQRQRHRQQLATGGGTAAGVLLNGSVDGYNLGLYATGLPMRKPSRAYIDSWYQYGAYNNSVDNALSASRYDLPRTPSRWKRVIAKGYCVKQP